MLLSVKLRGFGKHSDLTIGFSRFNILVGPNSIGKTTILDAISFFSCHYFRLSEKQKLLINSNSNYASLEVVFTKNKEHIKQKVVLQDNKQNFYHQDNKNNPFFYRGQFAAMWSDDRLGPLGPKERKELLIWATSLMFPPYQPLFSQTKELISTWKNLQNKQNFNAYDLQSIQNIEQRLAQNLFVLLQYQHQFLLVLNKQINRFFTKPLTLLAFRLHFLLPTYYNFVFTEKQEVFVLKCQDLLREFRNQKTQISLEELTDASFRIVFLQHKGFLSRAENKAVAVVLQLGTVWAIFNHTGQDVVFLLDDFDDFDFDYQKYFFSWFCQLQQFIIVVKNKDNLAPLIQTKKTVQVINLKQNG